MYSGVTGGLPIETLAGSASSLVDAGFGTADTRVATASTDGTVRVWAGPTPQASATLAPARLSPDVDALTTTIGFTSDGGRIVQASQIGQGQVLDAHTLKVLARFDGARRAGLRRRAANPRRLDHRCPLRSADRATTRSGTSRAAELYNAAERALDGHHRPRPARVA